MGVKVMGIAENMPIKLEESQLVMEDTSITLYNTKSVKLINKSDLMVKFKWMQFANDLDEEHQRAKLMLSLASEENFAIVSDFKGLDPALARRSYQVLRSNSE